MLRITRDLPIARAAGSVLTYVVDGSYPAHEFHEGQVAGNIPWDESFIVTSVVNRTADGRLGFNALDQEARIFLLEATKAGKLPLITLPRSTTHVIERPVPYRLALGWRSHLVGTDFTFVRGTIGSTVFGQASRKASWPSSKCRSAQRWPASEAVSCN